ncbi:hypothetical protein [Povalibacter sp.]|uniref:hypothetical protein n=1 Tax=Povalibacter sp. TaxID=1962978 RepID=UPI002F3FCA8A
MQFLILAVAWCLLLVVAWPLALAVIVLMPLLWLLSIPFRLVGVVLDAAIAFVKALLFLPARLLGHKG